MKLKLLGHTKRTEAAREKWLRIATDVNAGMSIPDIATRYGYTRQHVYLIIRKLKNEPIN